ncbi:hypothetical protein ACFVWZ_31665 [Streptomyces sp. NPDC058200]|uniref:hypothetical protein n=1 Tax=Streptomyces sp. NPDC058200 TaxID=3346378 RepID=UPI0036E36020
MTVITGRIDVAGQSTLHEGFRRLWRDSLKIAPPLQSGRLTVPPARAGERTSPPDGAVAKPAVRLDIQGLRALAISLVVADTPFPGYHAAIVI